MQSISERHFGRSDLAQLFAEVNRGRVKEYEIDGRVVIELSLGQKIAVPNPDDIRLFDLKPSKLGKELITVVNNNHGGNQSRRGFDRAYGGQATEKSRELWTYEDVDFARIAEEMGALGIRVDRPGDLAPALERALSAGRPVVVDVHTDIEVAAPQPVS